MAEMNKITSFKTFTQLRAEESAAKLAEERTAKRGELSAKLAAILDEMDIVSFEELDEETATAFINKAFGVVSEEETLEEGNAFIYAAAKAKAEGKKEFEFNGKTYKVSLKADTGLKESEEVSEAVINEAKLNKADTAKIAQMIADIFTQESADKKEFFKYVVNKRVDASSFDLDVEKTSKTPKKLADEPNYFGEYAGGSFIIKDEGDVWGVYNAAMGMASIEKFSKEDLSLVESTKYISEAVIVTGKRDAQRVMKAYEGFFNAYPALGRNAMGVSHVHHIGAVKMLYRLAMEDANFGREGNATYMQIKGKINPVEVKIADLNNATIKVPVSKLESLIEQHVNAISGAAKWSGLAIVEGTALYLDSVNQPKYAENLLAAFNRMFESVEVMESRILEGNAFGSARLKAIAAGKDEFEFDGKTYKVKSVDKEDKEAAEDFVSEGAKEEQDAMELYTQVAGPEGAYSEDELAKADMDKFMEIVTAAGHKGSKAKKIADEFRKIATMESVLFEATVEMDAMNPDDKDFLKFLKKHKVSIINKEMSGPGGNHPVITMQGKRKDLEAVLGDCDYGWCDEDLAEYIEESISLNENKYAKAGKLGYNDQFLNKRKSLAKTISTELGLKSEFVGPWVGFDYIDMYAVGPNGVGGTILAGALDGTHTYDELKAAAAEYLKSKKVAIEESVEVNENMELKKIEDAIKMFQDKIKSQGRVTNARDEDHLENLIRIYKEMGGKKIKESVEVNEAEVKSDDEFKEYAFTVLQKAFGEDFDEAKAQEVVDGLISKHSGDYGAMVGALQSSLG